MNKPFDAERQVLLEKPKFSLDVFIRKVKAIDKSYVVKLDENKVVCIYFNKELIHPSSKVHSAMHQELINFIRFFSAKYILVDTRTRKEYTKLSIQ
jgi:hypothetical protein